MSKQETDGSTIIISLDRNHKRNITINYQDLRPQTPRPLGNTALEILYEDVDCFELSFEDQNKDPRPFHAIFFNDNELDTIFDHARIAIVVSRMDNRPLDPKSGQLVRYSRDEAVQLGIVGGIEVINMD